MRGADKTRTGGAIPPARGAEPAAAAVAAPLEGNQHQTHRWHREPHARQALRMIQSEGKVGQYLALLEAQQAKPDTLALIVPMLSGSTLSGFCWVIGRALGVGHA